MTNFDFASVAKTIYGVYGKETTGKKVPCEERSYILIHKIYNAYLHMNGKRETLRILTEGDRMNACDEIYDWYAKKYVKKGRNEENNQGISKNITFKSVLYGTYHFNKPYKKNQFVKYLVKDKLPARNEDFLAFILHTAVAFLLEPAELDAILRAYGFHQLHGRNIHHLAIYAVLSQSERKPKTVALKINPFEQVKTLYNNARDILSKDEPEGPVELFKEDYTKWSRKALFTEELRDEGFFKIIREHRVSLTMRRKTILDDHHKFAAVFQHIFDRPNQVYTKSMDETEYSFYAFTNSFCCGHSKKSFRNKLFDQIDKYGKHPTRELMICYWLYALCFAYSDGAYLERRSYNAIVRKLKQYDAGWEQYIKECCKDSQLDVIKFVDGEPFSPKARFIGADIIDFIRSKISDHYEWGTLDNRNPFDWCIGQLAGLEFWIDDDGRPYNITYKGRNVHFSTRFPVTVPAPLAVIFAFLNHLKALNEYPLACSMYEQI